MKTSFFTKKDAVAEQLRTEILSGALAPGTQLGQDEVAARLEVSTTPVREAFRALEAEGLVALRPHRGVVVVDYDLDDVAALYELRALVEIGALSRAHEPFDADALDRLEGLVDQSRRALDAADPQETRRANPEFHIVLASLGGSRVYSEFVRALVTRSRSFIPLDRPRMITVLQAHEGILDALRAGDRATAIRSLEEHLGRNFDSLTAVRQPKPQRNVVD